MKLFHRMVADILLTVVVLLVVIFSDFIFSEKLLIIVLGLAAITITHIINNVISKYIAKEEV